MTGIEEVRAMLALWRPVPDASREILVATLHSRDLRVEHVAEHRWHWSVRSRLGSEIAAGDSPTPGSAEEAAEDEVYACHPPVGDWLEPLV